MKPSLALVHVLGELSNEAGGCGPMGNNPRTSEGRRRNLLASGFFPSHRQSIARCASSPKRTWDTSSVLLHRRLKGSALERNDEQRSVFTR